jgi:hypothetical protein
VLSWWWSVMFVGGREVSRGIVYWQEVLSSSVPTHGISHSKIGSYRAVLTPGKVMMLFRRVPPA